MVVKLYVFLGFFEYFGNDFRYLRFYVVFLGVFLVDVATGLWYNSV